MSKLRQPFRSAPADNIRLQPRAWHMSRAGRRAANDNPPSALWVLRRRVYPAFVVILIAVTLLYGLLG